MFEMMFGLYDTQECHPSLFDNTVPKLVFSALYLTDVWYIAINFINVIYNSNVIKWYDFTQIATESILTSLLSSKCMVRKQCF